MADTAQFTIGTGVRGRKEVAIPITAVAGTSDGIRLKIAKREVQDLPPVDIEHPDLA